MDADNHVLHPGRDRNETEYTQKQVLTDMRMPKDACSRDLPVETDHLLPVDVVVPTRAHMTDSDMKFIVVAFSSTIRAFTICGRSADADDTAANRRPTPNSAACASRRLLNRLRLLRNLTRPAGFVDCDISEFSFRHLLVDEGIPAPRPDFYIRRDRRRPKPRHLRIAADLVADTHRH